MAPRALYVTPAWLGTDREVASLSLRHWRAVIQRCSNSGSGSSSGSGSGSGDTRTPASWCQRRDSTGPRQVSRPRRRLSSCSARRAPRRLVTLRRRGDGRRLTPRFRRHNALDRLLSVLRLRSALSPRVL